MASNDRSDAPSSAVAPSVAADVQRTEVQPGEALAASVELSIPKHVQQHREAPKLSGYILTDHLGSGAYGQVWRAWQLRTRKEVAVKVFTQRTGLDWIFLQREVERLSRLDRHPNIVSLLDTGLEEEPPYYVTDLIEGGSLHRFVAPGATVSPTRAFRWFGQICDALEYVHAKGLIHCDLKPANILVDGQDRIRVVDFGQSRVFTESAASLGTLFYMAPEQAILFTPGVPVQPDVRWDVYALGATMYAILTGHVPYASRENVITLEEAPTLADRLQQYREMVARGPAPQWNGDGNAKIDRELIAVVEKCLERDPENRYPAVAALETDLLALRSKRPVSPLAKSRSYRTRKFVQRNPLLVALGAAFLILVGIGGWSWVQQDRLNQVEAREILAAFAGDPNAAAKEAVGMTGRTRRYTDELVKKYLVSNAFTERVLGSRAGVIFDPASFWRAIDEGPLWRYGEWLDVVSYLPSEPAIARWPVLPDLVINLMQPLPNGPTQQKYTALCLLGQFNAPGAGIGQAVLEGPAQDGNAGVAMTAQWCARRHSVILGAASSETIFTDEVSGQTFAAIPGAESFRRGSEASDPDRFSNEDRPAQGVTIRPFHMATTEVTLAGYLPFVDDPEWGKRVEKGAVENLRTQMGQIPREKIPHAAAGYISLNTARAYCDWLNAKAGGTMPRRLYRLPTEDEWEYACRAGNPGRFCFGDNADYARYFAHCNGSPASYHSVGERMPNAFGLSDMHGGVWEHTQTPYRGVLAPPNADQLGLFIKKGGAWYSPAVRCRSAQRKWASAIEVDGYTGIRLVMEITP